MADEIVYKKITRKADKGLEGKIIAKHGKQTNQKLKPYVVLQYLLKYSDENNTKSAYDIIGYLEDCDISAERRSIFCVALCSAPFQKCAEHPCVTADRIG